MYISLSVVLSGVEGFTTEEDQELLSRIEKQIKRRFIIGSQVSEHAIIQDFTRQVKARLLLSIDSYRNGCHCSIGLACHWDEASYKCVYNQAT